MQASFVFKLMAALTIITLPAAGACPCSEIKQPDPHRQPRDISAGLKFSDGEQYRQEFDAALENAKAACLRHKGEKNLAIVSDIDETLLDNRPEFERLHSTDWKDYTDWIYSGKAKTLPTAEFLKWARQQGIAIFLLTGRSEMQRRPTINNLIADEVSYDGLLMRGNNDHRLAEVMKTEYRKKIEEMGFKIIVSIGDQDSDLYGGSAEDCEKLPNKIYYIP